MAGTLSFTFKFVMRYRLDSLLKLKYVPTLLLALRRYARAFNHDSCSMHEGASINLVDEIKASAQIYNFMDHAEVLRNEGTK